MNEANSQKVNMAYFSDLLHKPINLNLVHHECHDRSHTTEPCDENKIYIQPIGADHQRNGVKIINGNNS